MKKIVASLVALLVCLPVFAELKQHNLEIAYEHSDYGYRGPHMEHPIRDHGRKQGASLVYTRNSVVSQDVTDDDPSFASLELRYMDGKVDYDDLPALSGHIKGIKPISQDATTTTTSATTTTKTFSTTTSITEYLEHSWTPEERFENFDIDEYKALLEEDVKSYPRRIDESIEQAYVEVMMAQVNNSSYCDQVPDKEWEEFCQLFNERVKAVYYNNPDNFTKEIHYFRNKLNRAPKTLLDLLKENAEYYRMYGEDKWQIMSAFGSSYHMFDTPACNNKGEYNLKFVSKNGLFEAVYNNDYQLLDETNDPINMGTYNYGDPNELNDAFDINSILNNNHFRLDMLTYTNEDYIQMAELINSILLIQSDKTGLTIGVTVISDILFGLILQILIILLVVSLKAII